MGHIPVKHIDDDDSGTFSIRDLAIVLGGKAMKKEAHRHDYYFVMFFEKGSGVHEIDFTTYPITDHCLFIIRPGQVHQIEMSAECTGFLLQFTTEFFFPYDKSTGQLLNYYQPQDSCFEQLVKTLQYLFKEYTQKKGRYQDVIKAQISSFLIELTRENQAGFTDQHSLHRQAQFDRFMFLLDQHILTHKQVSDYAKMMNLSIYQLNAITKSALNKTCSELINEQIVLEAKRSLLAMPYLVNQIASYMGYEDISYFPRFFKKHTGYSPEAFRQNFK